MKEFRPNEEMYLKDGCDIVNAIIESADISTEDGAKRALLDNASVISEEIRGVPYYPYALVEKVPSGIYPDCSEDRVWFYRWENGTYVPCERPERFNGVIGFTIG